MYSKLLDFSLYRLVRQRLHVFIALTYFAIVYTGAHDNNLIVNKWDEWNVPRWLSLGLFVSSGLVLLWPAPRRTLTGLMFPLLLYVFTTWWIVLTSTLALSTLALYTLLFLALLALLDQECNGD